MAMTVNDGHDSAWQYHENNIAKGALYTDKQALRDAVIKCALSTHRVMKTTVSSQKIFDNGMRDNKLSR